MFRAHSFLWQYLWLAPHVLQVVLAVLLWRRGLHRFFPLFFAYLIFESTEEFILYGMDISPSVSGAAYWVAFTVGLVIEGALKFAVVAELFLGLTQRRPALASTGNRLIVAASMALFLIAVVTAAHSPMDRPVYAPMYHAQVLLQSLYIIECGLMLFLFAFAAYFKLSWNMRSFGIAIGFALISCQHMGAWAVVASGGWSDAHRLIDFVNMATYHVCVLIWCYYLLVPQKVATKSAVALPENDLAMWNRELERLLQQ